MRTSTWRCRCYKIFFFDITICRTKYRWQALAATHPIIINCRFEFANASHIKWLIESYRFKLTQAFLSDPVQHIHVTFVFRYSLRKLQATPFHFLRLATGRQKSLRNDWCSQRIFCRILIDKFCSHASTFKKSDRTNVVEMMPSKQDQASPIVFNDTAAESHKYVQRYSKLFLSSRRVTKASLGIASLKCITVQTKQLVEYYTIIV